MSWAVLLQAISLLHHWSTHHLYFRYPLTKKMKKTNQWRAEVDWGNSTSEESLMLAPTPNQKTQIFITFEIFSIKNWAQTLRSHTALTTPGKRFTTIRWKTLLSQGPCFSWRPAYIWYHLIKFEKLSRWASGSAKCSQLMDKRNPWNLQGDTAFFTRDNLTFKTLFLTCQ